ncbi:unnamed protein product, partial [Polarella glacialis]
AAANGLDAVALGLAPQSVVSLLGAWSLAVNALTAPWLLQELRSGRDFAAVAAIGAGISLTLLGVNRTDRSWTTDEVLARFDQPAVVGYLFAVPLAAAGLWSFLRCNPSWHKAWPALGALIGSVTLTTAKATMLLLGQVAAHGSQLLTRWQAPAIILLFAASLPLQVYFINVSLSLNDALYHIPVFFVLWSLLSLVTAEIVFEEFSEFSRLDWTQFSLGVIVLFVGVGFSARRRQVAISAANPRGPQEINLAEAIGNNL